MVDWVWHTTLLFSDTFIRIKFFKQLHFGANFAGYVVCWCSKPDAHAVQRFAGVGGGRRARVRSNCEHDDFAYCQLCSAIGRRLALQVDHGYGPGAFMETRQEFLHGAHLVSEGV